MWWNHDGGGGGGRRKKGFGKVLFDDGGGGSMKGESGVDVGGGGCSGALSWTRTASSKKLDRQPQIKDRLSNTSFAEASV